MSRGPLAFKQSDIVRAVKAARAVGMDVERVEIAPDGRIVVVQRGSIPTAATSPLEAWKAKRDARASQGA